MSIDAELAAFFNEEPEQVIADSKQFRLKLGIGIDTYKMLSNVCDIAPLLSGGAMGTSVGLLGLQGTSGVLAFIGLGSTPIGWVALAGVVGAGAFYGGSQLLKKVKQDAVHEIPKYINSPIDVIASSILSFIAPIVFKLAKLDGQISDEEKTYVQQHFVNEWGFDKTYIDSQILSLMSIADNINFNDISNKINELVATGDVDKEQLINHVIELAEQLCNIDQANHDATNHELTALKKALMYGQSEWQIVATQYTENVKLQTQATASSALTTANNMGALFADKSRELIEKSAKLSKEGNQKLTPQIDNLKKKSYSFLKDTKSIFKKQKPD